MQRGSNLRSISRSGGTGRRCLRGPIAPEIPNTITLKAGDNTSVSDDGRSCVANIYGFAGLVEGLPTVLTPIWISEDHMEARFVHLPSEEAIPVPTEANLQELLELKWIEYGVFDQQIDVVRKRLERSLPLPTTLPIAQGTQEVHGENATIRTLSIRTPSYPGTNCRRSGG